jgi:hypothetical protein
MQPYGIAPIIGPRSKRRKVDAGKYMAEGEKK